MYVNQYIYVNLDNSYLSTSGNGTTATPYNKDQMEDFFDVTSSAIVYNYVGTDHLYCKLKGQWIEPTLYQAANFFVNLSAFSCNLTFEAWDLSVYGPWKMMGNSLNDGTKMGFYIAGSTGFNRTVTIKDGVLGNPRLYVNNNNISATVNFKNCLIYNGYYSLRNNASDKLYGCTIANSSILLTNYTIDPSVDNAVFENCVFYNSYFSPDNQYENISFSGCIFSGSSATTVSAISASASFTDTVFDWVPLTALPDFSEVSATNKNNLLYSLYGLPASLSGRDLIGTNNYRKGIFGDPRKGKGAFYFGDDIYFDLTINSGGYGTSTDPFGGNELENWILPSISYKFENEIYRMKGIKILSASFSNINFDSSYGNITYTNIPNEFWKIIITSAVSGTYFGGYNNLIISKGELRFENNTGNNQFNMFSNSKTYINSMFMIFCGSTYPRFCFYSNQFDYLAKGSTIISPTSGIELVTIMSPNVSGVFKDSILNINCFRSIGNVDIVPYKPLNIILCGCVLSAPDVSALDALCGTVNYRISLSSNLIASTISAGDCQFNWVPPIWPDENSFSKSDYSYVALTSASPITISGTGDWY